MVVEVIKLIDANKAKLAFLAPLITAIGVAAASWVVSGEFSATEIRAAVGGAILAVVSGAATYLAPAGRAEIQKRSGPGQAGYSLIELAVGLLVLLIVVLILFKVLDRL